jgi:hypothetical protein
MNLALQQQQLNSARHLHRNDTDREKHTHEVFGVREWESPTIASMQRVVVVIIKIMVRVEPAAATTTLWTTVHWQHLSINDLLHATSSRLEIQGNSRLVANMLRDTKPIPTPFVCQHGSPSFLRVLAYSTGVRYSFE